MGYTHYDKVSGATGLGVGLKGSEIVVANSSGSLHQEGTEITATAAELNTVVLTGKIPDVSTAGSAAYAVSPVAGTLSKIYTGLEGTIATADAVLTASIDGGTNITETVTIGYDSSAAGDVDSCTPADNNTVAVGSIIKLLTNNASTNAIGANVTFVITI